MCKTSAAGFLEAMAFRFSKQVCLILIVWASTAFGMPSMLSLPKADELFHASEHIPEIISYVEVTLMCFTVSFVLFNGFSKFLILKLQYGNRASRQAEL